MKEVTLNYDEVVALLTEWGVENAEDVLAFRLDTTSLTTSSVVRSPDRTLVHDKVGEPVTRLTGYLVKSKVGDNIERGTD